MSQKVYRNAPIVLAHPADLFGRGHYRIIQPAYVLSHLGMIRPAMSQTIFTDAALADLNPDVVVWNANHTVENIKDMRRYRKQLKDAFMVYETDDLVNAVPDGNIHKDSVPKDIGKHIREAISLCDAVCVTTDALATEIRKKYHCRDIRVAPNMIPAEVFDSVVKMVRKAANEKPRIGWAGGISHGGDLSFIGAVMDLMGDDYQWVFFGMRPPGVDPRRYEFHDPVSITDYLPRLAMLNLDVALAPLEINAFNACKSNLRLLEYGILDVPVVATDIEPYRGAPVSLVSNAPQEWADAIRASVGSPAVLRDWVRKHYIL
ncbi:MAG: glycosyltransferase family protein, partial [Sulfobacillus sp.]